MPDLFHQQLVIERLASLHVEEFSKNAHRMRIHTVVKNLPFHVYLTLLTSPCTCSTTSSTCLPSSQCRDFRSLTLHSTLMYDSGDERQVDKEVECLRLRPLEYRSAVESQQPNRCSLEVVVSVLSSQRECANFRLRIHATDATTGETQEHLVVYSDTITTISKVEVLRKKQKQMLLQQQQQQQQHQSSHSLSQGMSTTSANQSSPPSPSSTSSQRLAGRKRTRTGCAIGAPTSSSVSCDTTSMIPCDPSLIMSSLQRIESLLLERLGTAENSSIAAPIASIPSSSSSSSSSSCSSTSSSSASSFMLLTSPSPLLAQSPGTSGARLRRSGEHSVALTAPPPIPLTPSTDDVSSRFVHHLRGMIDAFEQMDDCERPAKVRKLVASQSEKERDRLAAALVAMAPELPKIPLESLPVQQQYQLQQQLEQRNHQLLFGASSLLDPAALFDPTALEALEGEFASILNGCM